MWVQSVVIHHMYQGKERRADGPASGYVSILPMSSRCPPSSSGRVFTREENNRYQLRDFKLVTDEHGELVLPNYQEVQPQQSRNS